MRPTWQSGDLSPAQEWYGMAYAPHHWWNEVVMAHSTRTEGHSGAHPVSQEQHAHPSELIGETILGLNDGIVTSLVFALSVSGANPGAYRAVVVAGLAEMIAGGVSMFLGGYTAARAVSEAYEYQVDVERHEIEHEPEEERAEVRRMYGARGFPSPLLEAIVHHITADRERWLHAMVRDELGAPPEEGPTAWQSGLAVGLAFMAGALVPVLPFLLHLPRAGALAAGLSLATLAITGAFRSRYSLKPAWRSAIELVGVGVVGTLVGLLVGGLLERVN
jgi:vacuolar iron transporter family protein